MRYSITALLAVIVLAGCSSVVAGTGSVRAVGPATGAPATASIVPSTVPSTVPSGPAAPPSTPAAGLIPYRGDRFSILLPGAPVSANVPVRTKVGTVTLHVLTVETSITEGYVVSYSDYPATAVFSLEGAVRGEALKTGGRISDLRRIVYRNRPARDFRMTTPRGTVIFARIVVVAHRVYEVQFVARGTLARPPVEYATVRDSLRF